ncbi:hypothetical protein ACFYNM_40000 [Streptomyces spororaveus]|uniref:hypothetical protein n=1 Tax=Streptomyces spororaveus TaxID=284039 RepID=UPI0036AA30D7
MTVDHPPADQSETGRDTDRTTGRRMPPVVIFFICVAALGTLIMLTLLTHEAVGLIADGIAAVIGAIALLVKSYRDRSDNA